MALVTYREAVRQALREELLNDERVILLGEDIAEFGGTFKVTLGLLEEFGPRRIRNTPISETAVLGVAVGAAATGLRPIVEIMYGDFFAVAVDQVVNQAAKMRYMFGGKISLPLTIRSTMGGVVRPLPSIVNVSKLGLCTSPASRSLCPPIRMTQKDC